MNRNNEHHRTKLASEWKHMFFDNPFSFRIVSGFYHCLGMFMQFDFICFSSWYLKKRIMGKNVIVFEFLENCKLSLHIWRMEYYDSDLSEPPYCWLHFLLSDCYSGLTQLRSGWADQRAAGLVTRAEAGGWGPGLTFQPRHCYITHYTVLTSRDIVHSEASVWL